MAGPATQSLRKDLADDYMGHSAMWLPETWAYRNCPCCGALALPSGDPTDMPAMPGRTLWRVTCRRGHGWSHVANADHSVHCIWHLGEDDVWQVTRRGEQ